METSNLNRIDFKTILANRLKPEMFEPVQPQDRLLKGFTFNEIRLKLAKQIGLIWLDIFELYGWRRSTPKVHPRQINMFHTSKPIALEVHNNWKTSNFDAKQSKFKTLKDFKLDHPNFTVIYGCINDFKNRDYLNRDYIRVLTNDRFLEYMLGNDWMKVERYLKDYITDFLFKNGH